MDKVVKMRYFIDVGEQKNYSTGKEQIVDLSHLDSDGWVRV